MAPSLGRWACAGSFKRLAESNPVSNMSQHPQKYKVKETHGDVALVIVFITKPKSK